MDWGVVTTVPACEHKAKADLTSVGFSCYFPRYESVEAVRGQIVQRARPLFPGYLFFGLIDRWRSVFQSERVLGVGMVGAGAGELIAEGVLAIEMAALASDVAMTIHPHPTLSETVMESAEVFFGTSTHVYRPKRA